MRDLLIKGGTVVSPGDGRAAPERADILVRDRRIAAIGRDLPAADAEVLDAAGGLLSPGLVDGHRHLWQSLIRGIAADWSLVEYVRFIRLRYGPDITAEEIALATELGAWDALDCGVTTLCDYSHAMNSPAHADAVVEALGAVPLHARLYYGFYAPPRSEPVFAGHADRLADAERVRRLVETSGNSRLSMGVALTEFGLVDDEAVRRETGFARDHGLPITAHIGTLSTRGAVDRLAGLGLLGPDLLHVHCNSCSDGELDRIADSGGHVCVTPETEMQMGMGFPVIDRLLARGLEPILGVDIVSACSGDLLTQLRLALQTTRAQLNQPALDDGRMPETVAPSCRDALRWGTVAAAEALGLAEATGSIEVGKRADLVLWRPRGLAGTPLPGPAEAILLHAAPAWVDAVVVDGQVVKRDGRLLSPRPREIALGLAERTFSIARDAAGSDATGTLSRYLRNIEAAVGAR